MDKTENSPHSGKSVSGLTSSKSISSSENPPDVKQTAQSPASVDDSSSAPGSKMSEGQSSVPSGSLSQSPQKEISRLQSRKLSGSSGKSQVSQGADSSQKPGTGEGRRRSSSTHGPKDDSKVGDKSLVGASSGSTIPSQGGAGGPGAKDVMAKMREVMSIGSAPAVPKMKSETDMPKGAMPDMMSMMSKGGMPDMMAMMAKGGMPDMMAMMAKGGMPDMKAMMGKGGGPMGMATLFDCIIEVSIAKADSEVSDDDDDSVTVEIPCQYCSRFFPNNMSLKTHILVAHDHIDSSVLNLKKLVIDGKGKRSLKDHHGSRRKQSRDCEKSAAVEAAGNETKQHEPSTPSRTVSSQEALSAAEPARGIKRSRSGSKASETEATESGGAACEEESSPNTEEGLHSSTRLGSGAVPSSCVTGSPQETRKRKARLLSQQSSSGESSSQVTSKKSKNGDSQPDSDSSPSKESSSGESPTAAAASLDKAGSDKSHGDSKETAKHKKVKTAGKDLSPVAPLPRAKRTLRKGLASSDTETGIDTQPDDPILGKARGRKGRQLASATAASASAPRDESPSTSTRSLRSRRSR